MRLSRQSLLSASAVFLISVVVYANTLGYEFVWDDYTLIVKNETVRARGWDAVSNAFTKPFVTVEGLGAAYYRPLTTLSYALDYRLHDGRAPGFHLTNVVLNALACVMAFCFLYLLFDDLLFALLAALIFAVHPIHTEAVAWISGRTDVLATLWSLVSLSLYVMARRRGLIWLLPALVTFALALLSKESAAAIPFLVLLLEWVPMKRRPPPAGHRGRIRSLAGPLLFFAVLALYLLVRRSVTGTITSEHPSLAHGWGSRVALPFSIFAGYVYKVLLPLDLNAEYDAAIPAGLTDAHAVAGLIMVTLVGWSMWRWRHSRMPVCLGGGIFVVGLAPVLNIVPIGEVSAERFLYFPSLGAAVILGYVLTTAFRSTRRSPGVAGRWTWLAPSLSIALILAFSVRTVVRNFDWRNAKALFSKTVLQEPNSARAHGSLAAAAERGGDVATAEREYQRALELKPDYAVVLVNLAELYFREGRYDDALPLIERAATDSPQDPRLIRNLALLYAKTDRFTEAANQYRRLLALDANDLSAHLGLGLALYHLGDPDAARQHFALAARGGRGYSTADYYLAEIEYAAGHYALARRHAERFLANYDRNDARRQRAEAIARHGN